MKKVKPYSGSKASKEELDRAMPYLEKSMAFVRKAQYRKAYAVAKAAYEKFPNNRFAQYKYAVLNGDSEEWASKAQHKILTRKAAKMLKALLRRTKGIDPRWVRGWRNEYYWFSRQPYKQYLLGVSVVNSGNKRGGYSMGVGAVSISLNSYRERKASRGKTWAMKAVKAWELYFKDVPDYYNSYVWYGQALGLSGDLAGMEKAFQKAAKLSGRKRSYREFVGADKDVRDALAASEKSKKAGAMRKSR